MEASAFTIKTNQTSGSVGAQARGFTMIEILIAIAIIAILSAVAIPQYSKFMTDTRRSDAISFLSEVAGEQVRYFSSNNEYAASMSELGYGSAATFESPEGFYTISVSNPGGSGRFLLTATPITGRQQANDAECLAFTISDTGVKRSTGTDTNCW